jgi:hypothetical protein
MRRPHEETMLAVNKLCNCPILLVKSKIKDPHYLVSVGKCNLKSTKMNFKE